MRRSILAALIVSSGAVAQTAPGPAAAIPPALPAVCPSQPIAAQTPGAGEKLRFSLDVYGADMGSLEIWLEGPARADRGKVDLVAHARAKTSAFVTTNVGPYSSFVTSKIGPGLTPLFAHEEVEDSGVRWLTEISFPAAHGSLPVHLSKDGEPQPLALAASPSARDLLSTFFAIRAVPLTAGAPICFEVFAGRHLWKMSGTVATREPLETPLGKIASARIDLTSVRLDDPRVVRTTHFWISDDERRLPLAAVAEVKGKVIRAQLAAASGRGWSLGN